MAAGNERSMKALKEVWKRAENSLCADCGKPDPDWASSTLGVFICLSCSGIHRNIPSISKVKSLKMDYWDDAQVQVRSLSPWVGQVVWTRVYTQCPCKISPLTSQSWNVIWFNQSLFYSGKSGITPHNRLGEGGHTCLMCLCMSCYSKCRTLAMDFTKA